MDDRKGETPAIPESARRVREAADHAAKDVKTAAMNGVEDARAKAGDMGHTTASRLRGLAEQAEQDMPWLATALGKSASGLDNVTDSLTRGDMRQCVQELSDFARRQPAIFIGASVALGFALSRVGKTALEGGLPSSAATPEPKPQPFDGLDASGTTYPPAGT
jgi:hypothetical protein